MLPHQKRVVAERNDLVEKGDKLNSFIFGEVYCKLSSAEQIRLCKQYAFMRAYLEVLDERIAAFGVIQ